MNFRDIGAADHLQIFTFDALLKVIGNEFFKDILADLVREPGADQVRRHLAGPEPRDLRLLLNLGNNILRFTVDFLDRNGDLEFVFATVNQHGGGWWVVGGGPTSYHLPPTTILGSFRPTRQILLLLRREAVDLDAHGLELQLGDMLVQVLRYRVNALFQRRVVLHHVVGGKRLVGEAHVHDRCRMAFGGRKVDQSAFAEHIDAAPVAHHVLFDELAGLPTRGRQPAERLQVDFDVEVAGVADDGAVLEAVEMIARDHILVARDGHEHVAHLRRLCHRHHAKAVHQRFYAFDGIDFGHDDVGAHAARPHRQPFAAPAVAPDHES